MENALVSQFMEITVCKQAHAERQLSSCQWNLEKAVNLFFAAGGAVTGLSAAAPSPPVEEKEEEVRAPIPTRMERLYDESYHGSSRTVRAAQSMWDAPSPKPVPVQGLSHSDEIHASGWGEVQPDNISGNGNNAEEEQVREAEPGNGGDDQEGEEADKEENNASDNESDSEYYDLDTDEDDGYDDLLVEDEEEQPRPESLAQMYRLPYELMYRGTFHYAKVHAAMQDQFLLVNIQTQDFASCQQNRDLWANDVVSQAVKANFVFLLLRKLHDYSSEGEKVCTFYNIQDDQLPTLLVLDPITGQMLNKMSGSIQPDEFMLFIDKYTNSKPSEQSSPKIVPKTVAVVEGSKATVSAGGEQEQGTPENSATPGVGAEEPEQEPAPVVEEAPAEMVDSGDDESMEGEKMYKLRVRFPDGRVVPKEFGCKRRVSKLFAFVKSARRDAGKTERVAFRIMKLAGLAFEELHNNGTTFEELDLNFATVSVVFGT